MVYDILPSADLRADDIRDTIGIASNNLSHYIVKAKTGGKDGYAFRIKENGYARTDGDLIDGAEPYFNLYSNFSPAEWIPGTAKGTVTGYPVFKCRLKRHPGANIVVGGETITSACYCFNLGAFAGYRHKAEAPSVTGEQDQYVNLDDFANAKVYFSFNPGATYWYKTLGLSASDCRYGLFVYGKTDKEQQVYLAEGPASPNSSLIAVNPVLGANVCTVQAALFRNDAANTPLGEIPGALFAVSLDLGHGELSPDNQRFKGIVFSRNASGTTASLPGLSYNKNPRATVNQWGEFSIRVDLDPNTFPWIPGPPGGGEIWCDLKTTILRPRPGNLPEITGTITKAYGITDNDFYNDHYFVLSGFVPGWDSANDTYIGAKFELVINQ